MSLKAQVHLLAEKYGWTIEYVMKLTRKQISCMFEGELEILEMKEQHRKTPNTNSGGDKKGVTTGKGDSLYEIMSMPGMKLSEKAKKRLLKIRDKKMKAKNG